MSVELLPKPIAPVLDQNLDNVVVVDGLPVVDAAKYDKLLGFIKTKFAPFGAVLDVDMPRKEDGNTHGFLFVQYGSAEEAKAAIAGQNGKPMDKSHTFRVSLLCEYDRVASAPETFQAPDTEALSRPPPQLHSWLQDSHGRDQFALRCMEGDEHHTHIFWNDPLRKQDDKGRDFVTSGDEETLRAGKSWTEFPIKWSRKGAYLATFHLQGVALWGGENFERVGKFGHAEVRELDFSPCERFLATVSVVAGGMAKVCVWDVRTGALLRVFEDMPAFVKLSEAATPAAVAAQAASGPALAWPLLQWSHDGRYCARALPQGVSVHELPSMAQLDGRLVKAEGCGELAWCPTRNALAYVTPAKGATPGAIVVVDLPSRKVVREKHIFEAVSAKLQWQAKGDLLVAQVARRKTKKTFAYTLEIFDFSKRAVPVEEIVLEQPGAFAVDPVRPFVAVTSAVPAAPGSPVLKCEVAIYKVALDNSGSKKVAAFPLSIAPNFTYEHYSLHWSPAGSTLVAASLAPAPPQFVFIDAGKPTPAIVAECDHDLASGLHWDPSGRFLVSAVTRPFPFQAQNTNYAMNWRDKIEDNYRVYSFQGTLLHQVAVERLYQFMWRPRPPTTLSAEQVAEIAANLRATHWKKYDAEDDACTTSKKSEYTKRRQAIKAAWREFRSNALSTRKSQKAARTELRRGVESDDESDFIEVTLGPKDAAFQHCMGL